MTFNPETFRELDLEPVRAAARLFREYVQMHADKFEPFGQSAEEHAAITAKCERNANAADSLEKWLATHAQEIAGLVEENARLRGLVGRAQINGNRLPIAWHKDARTALAKQETEHG